MWIYFLKEGLSGQLCKCMQKYTPLWSKDQKCACPFYGKIGKNFLNLTLPDSSRRINMSQINHVPFFFRTQVHCPLPYPSHLHLYGAIQQSSPLTKGHDTAQPHLLATGSPQQWISRKKNEKITFKKLVFLTWKLTLFEESPSGNLTFFKK